MSEFGREVLEGLTGVGNNGDFLFAIAEEEKLESIRNMVSRVWLGRLLGMVRVRSWGVGRNVRQANKREGGPSRVERGFDHGCGTG